MPAPDPISIEHYQQFINREIGVSRWFLLDQSRIDLFATATEDNQFIHVDPEAAGKTSLGGTIAHGFLSLSMLGGMGFEIIPPVAGAAMSVNYGLNTVRFLKPVASGKRVRGRFLLKDLQERGTGQWQSTFMVTVEIEDEEKPALLAEWLILTMLAQPAA